MASLFLAAELLGRQRSAFSALAFAAAVMVAVSPRVMWTASFQLSFLATLGMVLVAPPLHALGRKAVARFLGENGIAVSIASLVVDAGAISLGAIIMTWPVISYSFGLISLVGLPATLLVSPALAGIIPASVATGILGLVVPVLAQVAAWVDWLFLTYMHGVAGAFSLLPLASVEVKLSSGLVLAYYLLIIVTWLAARAALARFSHVAEDREQSQARGSPTWSPKVVLPSFLAVTILVWVAALSGPREQWRVSFLDVGQGQAILVQAPGRDVLIDGGPSPQKLNLELSRQLPFWDRKIELVVSTQPHADHLAGLVGLLERYDVGEVLEPEVPYPSLLYQEWRKILKEKGIRHTRARVGQEIRLGAVARIEVLNPQAQFLKGKDGEVEVDDNGVVLRLVVGEVSFLFTADITVEGERELIFRRALSQSDVLAVAHHGSKTSTSEGFLAVVKPQVAIISSGAGNRFGHPDTEVVKRLKWSLGAGGIYLTQERGT
ncbi:MAG: ComEC/Rec2 family competence protein, partial [Dehalococcoidia bacterium]|nr:ComEC/Rec2 family competence protein [Dehalococcoidia bacterium]